MKYEIVKGVIKKSDFTSEYSPEDFKSALLQTEKKLTEITAQQKIYNAKAENVVRNHPHVLKLDEEKRNAVWLFHENFVASKQADTIIKALKKDIKGLNNEMKEIEKQTGFSFNK